MGRCDQQACGPILLQSLALDPPPVNPSSPKIPASPCRPKFPAYPSSEPYPMDPDSRTAQTSGHRPTTSSSRHGPRNQACLPTLAPGLLPWPMHQPSPCGSRHQANLGGLWHQAGPHRIRISLIPMYPDFMLVPTDSVTKPTPAPGQPTH